MTTPQLLARTVLLGLLFLPGLHAQQQPCTWPHGPDPQWAEVLEGMSEVIGDPEAGSCFYLDRIEFQIPNDPEPYADWITHWHAIPLGSEGDMDCNLFGGVFCDFAIGDVDNDGVEDDIVFTMAGEAVFAAKMVIDWESGTGSLDPLWLWLTPYATSPQGLDSEPLHTNTVKSCLTRRKINPLVWNVVPDGQEDDTNEVVFVGLDEDENEHIYVLRTDMCPDPENPGELCVEEVESAPGSPFRMPELLVNRLGICRVSNTGFPRDIVASTHDAVIRIYSHGPDGTEPLGLAHYIDPSQDDILTGTHEVGMFDIDRDGFTEFYMNGLVDLVDLDEYGNLEVQDESVRVRHQYMQGYKPEDEDVLSVGHCDQTVVADWDPDRPGLEVLMVPEWDERRYPMFWLENDSPSDPIAPCASEFDPEECPEEYEECVCSSPGVHCLPFDTLYY